MDILMDVLKQLRACTEGHVEAYKSLMADVAPYQLERLYSKEAGTYWQKALNKDPMDWMAYHHLAILNHARAFDLEAEGNVKEAEEAWKQAHQNWYKLFNLQDFEPFSSIQNAIQKMDRYKPEEHDAQFENLKNTIEDDLLNVPRNLYSHYMDQGRPADADCHYRVLEHSPFKRTNHVIRVMYEEGLGKKVRAIVDLLKKKKNGKSTVTFLDEVEDLHKQVSDVSKKHQSLSAVLRDRVILTAWKLRLALSQWMLNVEAVLAKQKDKLKELKRLNGELSHSERRIKELEQMVASANTSRYQEYSGLIEQHNRNVRRVNALRDEVKTERESVFASLSSLENDVAACEMHLADLTPLNHPKDLQLAVLELQEAINEILFLPTRAGEGVQDILAYRKLVDRCKEALERVQAYQANINSSESLPEEEETVNTSGIWDWAGMKKEENPYLNTSFILLETELPSDIDALNVSDLVRAMKRKKQSLERKARARKHIVMGRQVKLEELNRVVSRLDIPVDLARDMLLQHWAHHADLKEVINRLSEVALPDPEIEPLELSREPLFSFFELPDLPGTMEKQWKKPDKEPAEKPIPEIKWPT